MSTLALPERPASRTPGQPGPSAAGPARLLAALIDWLLKRGILFVLLMTPITALFLGLVGITPVRVGYLALALAFLALPVWVVWRRSVATDMTEPVFHIHKYMLYALFPYVVFSVVRAPLVWMIDFSYWGPWFTFGSGVTGHDVGTYPALAAGAALYSLQGYSLAMGFFTLFKRHNVTNAMLYFFGLISSLYSFVFPVLLLTNADPGLRFHLTNYWAHLWMGLAAVAVPLLFVKVWPRLKARGKSSVAVGLVAIWLFPYAFAFGMATFWQYDRQDREEFAAFDALTLQVGSTAPVSVADGQARYTVEVLVGPREFSDYLHWHNAIGAEDIQIDGVLTSAGVPIAWCASATGSLPMPQSSDPPTYRAELEALDHTTIPVTCRGPASTAQQTPAGSMVRFEYEAQMTLRLERNTQPRQYVGTAETVLAAG